MCIVLILKTFRTKWLTFYLGQEYIINAMHLCGRTMRFRDAFLLIHDNLQAIILYLIQLCTKSPDWFIITSVYKCSYMFIWMVMALCLNRSDFNILIFPSFETLYTQTIFWVFIKLTHRFFCPFFVTCNNLNDSLAQMSKATIFLLFILVEVQLLFHPYFPYQYSFNILPCREEVAHYHQ